MERKFSFIARISDKCGFTWRGNTRLRNSGKSGRNNGGNAGYVLPVIVGKDCRPEFTSLIQSQDLCLFWSQDWRGLKFDG